MKFFWWIVWLVFSSVLQLWPFFQPYVFLKLIDEVNRNNLFLLRMFLYISAFFSCNYCWTNSLVTSEQQLFGFQAFSNDKWLLMFYAVYVIETFLISINGTQYCTCSLVAPMLPGMCFRPTMPRINLNFSRCIRVLDLVLKRTSKMSWLKERKPNDYKISVEKKIVDGKIAGNCFAQKPFWSFSDAFWNILVEVVVGLKLEAALSLILPTLNGTYQKISLLPMEMFLCWSFRPIPCGARHPCKTTPTSSSFFVPQKARKKVKKEIRYCEVPFSLVKHHKHKNEQEIFVDGTIFRPETFSKSCQGAW